MRLERAQQLGIELKGFRSERCPKGHLKLGENAFIRPSGYRVCRECDRMRARERLQRLRAGRPLQRPRRLLDVLSPETVQLIRTCGLPQRATAAIYGVPTSFVSRVRRGYGC